MKTINHLKVTVISFIIAVLFLMLVICFMADMSERAYADAVEVSQHFVGKPASLVLDNYGYPEGWAFSQSETDDIVDGTWYYDSVVFYVHYDNEANTEGVISGAEVIRK